VRARLDDYRVPRGESSAGLIIKLENVLTLDAQLISLSFVSMAAIR